MQMKKSTYDTRSVHTRYQQKHETPKICAYGCLFERRQARLTFAYAPLPRVQVVSIVLQHLYDGLASQMHHPHKQRLFYKGPTVRASGSVQNKLKCICRAVQS